MKNFTIAVTVCLFGAVACSSIPTNDGTKLIRYEPVPRPVLLRALVRTQNQLLDQLLWDAQLQRADYSQTDGALSLALTTVYCDLIGRGVVESQTHTLCDDYASSLSRQCSRAYYRRIARLESLHTDCVSCVTELQVCLSQDH